uniref:Peptidase family M48 n=1 Tax=Candidatus Kentrum sp. LPFa TaxID=2126335 RepID=A0A450XWH7_9GAMM|nr:MAG: Peptidase family M48 [Candidatus Kentron sp. LPFa]VFK33664.1 MAG: Peptidase family M48 [Candidatus Kentron sp. LPFa]
MDDLVELLDEDEFLAIVAHEYSHIEDRHSLKQIIELIGVSVLAHILFGVDDSLIEEMTAVAIDVRGFRNSRDFEKKADLKAIGILKANDIDPANLVEVIGKLMEYGCKETDAGSSRKCLSKAETGWLSTHPGDEERFGYLSERIDPP